MISSFPVFSHTGYVVCVNFFHQKEKNYFSPSEWKQFSMTNIATLTPYHLSQSTNTHFSIYMNIVKWKLFGEGWLRMNIVKWKGVENKGDHYAFRCGVWRNTMKGWNVFIDNSAFKVGDESRVSFGGEKWCKVSCLRMNSRFWTESLAKGKYLFSKIEGYKGMKLFGIWGLGGTSRIGRCPSFKDC